MLKKVLVTLFILSLLPLGIYAQSAGKIIGQVTDKTTGEPLPGVNVTIENTLMGANTDIEGFFFILNVPVGEYDVRASYIGYQDMLKQGVRVSGGITSETGFELTQTTLELDEVIVVTGEKPLVEKHVTQSYSLVTSENIETIPVRGINNLLALQASVVAKDGEIYIRGGREDEVGYYLDGASINNPMNNERAVNIIQDAVEEIQVLTGGYNAEFGNANSGIVRAELKTGTSDYHASIDIQTDNFVDIGDSYLGGYSYGTSYMTATASGPIVSKDIRLFVAVENLYNQDSRKRFSKGFQFDNVVDMNTRNPDVEAGHPDIMNLSYPDGFTPANNFNSWTLNSTLLFDFSPFQIRLSGVYDFYRQRRNDVPMLSVLNRRSNWTDQYETLLSAKFTHILNPTTFYNVKLSYMNRDLNTEDSYFGDNWRLWNDSLAIAGITGGQVVCESRWELPYRFVGNGFSFRRNGDTHNGFDNEFYTESQQQYIGGAVDFITQYNKYNEIKFGVDAKYYTLRRFQVDPGIMKVYEQQRIENLPVTRDLLKDYLADLYGYDVEGNKINKGVNGAKHPVYISFYAHDKMEFQDLIINAGLRYDYFYTDDRQFVNPMDPEIDEDKGLFKPEALKKQDAFQHISPRLGISFPITERTVFYTQYGKFVQMPQFSNIYLSDLQLGRQVVTGGYYFNTPVGINLGPMFTTSYEIGFRQQLSDMAAFDITGFYRNIKGQVNSAKAVTSPGALVAQYEYLQNGDFATTKGLEFKVVLRRTHRLATQFNYTYSNAIGTGSNAFSYQAAAYYGSDLPTTQRPLDQMQEHRGTVNLDYRFGLNDGGQILERLGLNLLFDFASGHPYTQVFVIPGGQVSPYSAGVDYETDNRWREAVEPLNDSRTPWTFNIDFRLDKTFSVMDDLNATVYVRVTNLLNTKNVMNVYGFTGNATDDGFLTDRSRSQSVINAQNNSAQYVEMYKAINIENGQAYLDATGNELYSKPREILFGIKLSY